MRLIPLQELTLKNVLAPIRKTKDQVSLRSHGQLLHGKYELTEIRILTAHLFYNIASALFFYVSGKHKTYNKYGKPIINITAEEYELLILYIEKLRKFEPTTDDQYLFCRSDGKALQSIANIIPSISKIKCKSKYFLTNVYNALLTCR